MPGTIHPIQQTDPADTESAEWVYERLASALRIGERPIACDNSLRRLLLKRVLAAIPPPGTRTVRAAPAAWNELAPGVSIKLLRVDHGAANMTAFLRMEPGSLFGAHRHAQDEECLVLEGEIFIGKHRLGAGDMHVAGAGTEHAMVRSPQGALMLVRGSVPATSPSCTMCFPGRAR